MSLNNVDSSNGYLEATAADGIAVSEVITQETGPDIISSSASNEFTTFNVVNVGDDLVIKKLDDTTHELSVVNVDQNPISIKESVTMTSYTNAEGFIVTVSSASNPGTFDGFDAFNDTSDTSHFWRSNGAGAGNWIAMEFPVAKVINNIDINGYRDGASSSTLKGCDVHGWDGSAYVLLGSFTFSSVWANYEVRNISFANSTAYIKYKITATSVKSYYFVSSYVAFLYNGDGYTVDTTSITAGEIPQAVYELSGYDNAFSSVKNIQSKEEYANISEAIVADTLATSSPIVDGDNLVIVKDDDSIHEVVASGVVSLEDNLVAFYPLNVDSSDCTGAYDGASTGVDFNGNVAEFDGVDDKIETSNLSPNAWDAFTISIWYRQNTSSTSNRIYSGDRLANGDELSILTTTDGTIRFSWYNRALGSYVITEDASPNLVDARDGELHNIIAIKTATNVYLYVDSILSIEYSITGVIQSNVNTHSIGFFSTIYSDMFASNMRIYSDAKDQVFIDNLYAEGVYTPSCANYSMDTTAITAGEIPSKVFTVDSKVAFDDGTGFVYPSELGNDYLAVESEVPATDLTPGLVAHYLLNNNADDNHGTYDGTPSGGVDFQGDVASFDGTDDEVGIGQGISAFKTNSHTISAWFYVDSVDSTRKYIVNNNQRHTANGSSDNSGSGLYVDTDNKIRLVYDILNDESTTDSNGFNTTNYLVVARASSNIVVDTLYHVVGVVDGTSAKLYIDGVLDSSVTSTQSIQYGTLDDNYSIGANEFDASSTYFIDGIISNVRHYSDAKNQTFIDDLYTEGYYPNPLTEPTTTGLIAHYPLTGTAEDTTGTYDGVENGNTYVDDAEFGSVADFDGINDYIQHTPTLSTSTITTISAWVNVDTVDAVNSGYIIDTGNRFIISNGEGVNTSNISFYDGVVWVYTTTPFTLNTWQHLVVIANGTSLTIYLDNVIIHSGTITANSIGGTVAIGSRFDSTASYFDGNIRDVRIYNTALTTQEITDIYNYEKNFRSIDIDDGLVAYYPLANNSLDNYHNEYDGTDTAVTYDGESATFTGNTQHIQTSAHTDTEGAISFWVKRTASTVEQYRIWSQSNIGGGDSEYISAKLLSTFELQFNHKGADIFEGSTVLVLDEWYHVIVQSDGVSVTAYLNGLSEALTPTAGTNTGQWLGDIANSDNFSINRFYRDGTDDSSGHKNLKNFRIYDKALTPEQIEVIYNTEKGEVPNPNIASLSNTRQYDDITINGRSIETKVELKSLGDKCTEVSADLWKNP